MGANAGGISSVHTLAPGQPVAVPNSQKVSFHPCRLLQPLPSSCALPPGPELPREFPVSPALPHYTLQRRRRLQYNRPKVPEKCESVPSVLGKRKGNVAF